MQSELRKGKALGLQSGRRAVHRKMRRADVS